MLTTTIGVLAGILIPGFSLTLPLYPRLRDLEAAERLGLSMVLGLSPAVLMYFLDKNLGLAFDSANTLAAYAFITITGIGLWVMGGGGGFIKKSE